MPLLTTSVLMAVALAAGCEPAEPLVGPQLAAQQGEPRDSALGPGADTYLRQGTPNQNQGTESVLKLQASGKNRALLWWDPAAIRGAVGADSLASARLELIIALNADNWGSSGRTIDLHRLTQAWTELGATWNCADDTDPTNPVADCSGETAWAMDGPSPRPWVTAPTATQVITNGLTGVVTLNVTADVADLLTGSGVLHGWILKKTDEGASGRVDFGSRESATPPRLVLTLVVGTPPDTTWPLLTGINTLPALDTTRLVALPSGRLVYRTDITLRFKDGVTDSAKAAFFRRHGMSVVGVTRSGQFFVRIPDPGPSLDSLFSLLERLRSEPEILVAASLDFSPLDEVRDTRFPEDGPGQSRSDWFSGTANTWAMRAIRAPLAWGCETGTYGGALASVGVFEYKHQSTHPEFARSSPALWQPPDSNLAHIPSASPAKVVSNETHATAVTGQLTAEGDNGSGHGGVNWQTDLHLYAAYSSPGNHPLPVLDNFFALAEPMVNDQLRVLSFSADAVVDSTKPAAEREAQIRALAVSIDQDLLSKLRELVVVVAAGNERYRGTDSLYFLNPRAAVIRAALLVLRSNPDYRDRIIVVAGTIPGNRFWDSWPANPVYGSNFFTGHTGIAAPAQDVTVLDRWTGQTGTAVPLRVATGTSLAAPMVAGVAAQLLAMDSTLTAAEVKDYILRGAREPKGWSAPGVPIAATPVAGAPETIYQLDAYGALSLLARERPSTPICGLPVGVSPDYREVLLHRNEVQRLTPSLSENAVLGFVSVAQGGRRLALQRLEFEETGTVTTVLETDHHGSILRTVTDADRRWYLETDTADVTAWDRPVTVVLRGAGGVDTIPVSSRVGIPAGWRVYWGVGAPSPDGAWFAAFHLLVADGSPALTFRWDLVPLRRESAVVPVYAHTLPQGWAGCTGSDFCEETVWAPMAEWSPSGRRVWLPVGQQRVAPGIFDARTLVFTVPLVDSLPHVPGSPAVLDGTWAWFANVPAVDSVVRTRERIDFIAGGCVTRLRWATAPATEWGTMAAETCDDPGRLFNAPRRTAGRQP